MKFLFALIFFVVSVLMTLFLGSREWHMPVIAIATIVGFLLGQSFDLSKQLKQLRKTLAEDWEARNALQTTATEDQITPENTSKDTPPLFEHISESEDTQTQQPAFNQQPEEYLDVVKQAASSVEAENISQATEWNSTANVAAAESSFATAASNNSNQPNIADNIIKTIKGYFTGGNIFVRIGIIILFFGVSFLLKYVSDRGFFPIEYRLIAVVVGAMFLLGLGWRLRHKNETYALLLQGAGIGILYLDIFAAFSIYQLIPPFLAFVLLFIVSMLSAALAVLQNSKSLAALGFSGGFLAPVLASSGSNNHIALFSYYAVLNVAIVAIAWFKAWRELNLLGFAFTFIIGTLWGVLRYDSDKFFTTEPFLILFFVFYVLIAVLYALRQPPKLRGYVDGTLLFGVPLAASALQYYLVKDFEYGVSISSFVMGLFYLLLAGFIWKRKGDGLKLLAEAFLALGVIFASMAIPFALAPTQTAAAWALEGAGLIWLGSRQNRLSVRAFGVLLQLAAGMIFLARFDFSSNINPFINGEFISSMMLAVGGILSARILIMPFTGQKNWEKLLSPMLLVWGLIWLVTGFAYQLLNHYPEKYIASTMLIFLAVISLSLVLYATRLKPIWKHAVIAAFTLFLGVLLMALAQPVFTLFSNLGGYHPAMWYGWLAWPIVFVSYYYILHLTQKHELFPRFQSFFHTVLLLLAVLLITIEGIWWIAKELNIQSSWLAIWYAIPASMALWMIIKANLWPFKHFKASYQRYSGSILAVALALWSFVALIDKGASDPLPWIPVLNPLDIMLTVVFISLYKWWQCVDGFSRTNAETVSNDNSKFTLKNKIFNKRLFVMGFAVLTFLWLNFTLFRIAHHWFAIPYNDSALYASSLVQTAVSILWAFTGVTLTLFASRNNNRLLWVIGAILLAMVVLKLFVIDLSALGSLGRVVSFLVVGALLTSIGYFAPLPDKTTDDENDDSENDKNNQTQSGEQNA